MSGLYGLHSRDILISPRFRQSDAIAQGNVLSRCAGVRAHVDRRGRAAGESETIIAGKPDVIHADGIGGIQKGCATAA